ncbi:MAG: methyltransferase domain-containing protein [Spirochaetes bacterium]|nr:methyltransferase domain-containing protein [Spirochaetota bacterium]
MKERSRYLKQLKDAGVGKAILGVVSGIDRLKFFDPIFSERVYSMETIPIGFGQKSDDPLILMKMIGHMGLKKKFRVLEVGTGSGYSTAVISGLVREVVTVDYHEDLARIARERLLGQGYRNTRFYAGDATDFDGPLGLFDAAIILAACVRTPYFVINALKPGGVAVFPMGPAHQQQIARCVNDPDVPDISRNFRFYDLCSFNSIRGIYGWVDVDDTPVPEVPDKPGGEGEEEPAG